MEFWVSSGDVTIQSSLDTVGQVDAIVHAAGFLGVDAVREDPLRTLDANVLGARVVMQHATDCGRVPVVMLSTSEVYGPYAANAVESMPSVVPAGGGRWSYAASKVAAEQYALAHAGAFGTPVSVVRPFNVYGPDRRGSSAIGRFVRLAVAGQDLVIHGSGQHVRAWCHVGDFCSGVMALLDLQNMETNVVNLGNPAEPVTVLELAEMVRAAARSKSSIVHVPGDDDVVIRFPDISWARSCLGYAPRITLRDGIAESITYAQYLIRR